LFELAYSISKTRAICAPTSPAFPSISRFAMNEKKVLRLKPQNLLVNLPLAMIS
jgi:hypothetical protein